jgi:hypothetical protein
MVYAKSKRYKFDDLSETDLEERLRRLGSIWFRNDDLLLLEEMLRRYKRMKEELDVHQINEGNLNGVDDSC